MAILYPASEGSCNDISVDGENIPRTDDGGFDVPDHLAGVILSSLPGLTTEKPAAPAVKAGVSKKGAKPEDAPAVEA
jgi:hypothetical protein